MRAYRVPVTTTTGTKYYDITLDLAQDTTGKPVMKAGFLLRHYRRYYWFGNLKQENIKMVAAMFIPFQAQARRQVEGLLGVFF